VSAATTFRLFRPDPLSAGEPEAGHRARFTTSHLNSSTVLVSVEGEVDASNAGHLADYVERQAAGCARLVVDLSALEFFGTPGFSALYNIKLTCSRHGVDWVVIVGNASRRLFGICDQSRVLPAVDGLESAVKRLNRGRRQRRQPMYHTN
jgi:anti-anti-sigma factor